jgi:tetratricopeptide (TPR) repeat protein
MAYRLVAAFFFLYFATSFPANTAAQNRSMSRQGDPNFPSDLSADSSPAEPGLGRITGTIRTFDGHGINKANIQVHDIGRGDRFYTALSDSSGSFALYNIPPGDYEVTASTGVDEAHERVQVGGLAGDSSIDFRIRDKSVDQPVAGSGATVSLSQYRVPAKARSLYEKAIQCMKRGKIDEAFVKVEAALVICPKFPEALTLRGALLQNAGKQTEALADLQQAMQYDANYALAYLTMASIFNSTGRFAEALVILNQAERLAPDAWQTYYELARADAGTGKFADALRNVNRASELQGGPEKEIPEMHLVRANALIGTNELLRASHELETFLAREPRGQLADQARTILDQIHAGTVTASR